MKTSIFLSSLAAALLLAPVLVSAQTQDVQPAGPNPRRQGPPMAGQMGGQPGQMGPMGQMRPMKPRRDIKAELGLTDVQRADIRKARENARRERLRKSTDLKIANLDLKSLLRAEKVDEKAIATKLAEAQAAQGALLKLRVDTALAMKRILTPEQQKKLEEIRGENGRNRMGRRMMRRGMRMHGMNGPGAMGPHMMPGMRDDDSELDLEDEEGAAPVLHGDIR
jgi:Spy/CpxP family protein refolding chaperone